MDYLKSIGFFIYPLGICYCLAAYLLVERFFALRATRVFPKSYQKALASHRYPEKTEGDGSIAERLVSLCEAAPPNPDLLRRWVEYEVSRLERGFFLLEVIIAGAPLIGLLGTITGLIRVFSGMTLSAGAADPIHLAQGISLALLTTFLGLGIALPTLLGHGYLTRKVEIIENQLGLLVEHQLINKDGA